MIIKSDSPTVTIVDGVGRLVFQRRIEGSVQIGIRHDEIDITGPVKIGLPERNQHIEIYPFTPDTETVLTVDDGETSDGE